MKNRNKLAGWIRGIIPLFILFGALVILPETAFGQTVPPPSLCLGPDTDSDCVADAVDNCVYNFNPNQVDTDTDGYGDKCDTDTMNPAIERPIASGPIIIGSTGSATMGSGTTGSGTLYSGGTYVADTPQYRAAFTIKDSKPCFVFALGAELLTPSGLPQNADLLLVDPITNTYIGDHSRAIAYCLASLNIGGNEYSCSQMDVPPTQSTWQSLMMGQFMCTSLENPALPIDIRVHAAPAANSIGIGVEIFNLDAITGPIRVAWEYAGALFGIPSNLSFDMNRLDEYGRGKITLWSLDYSKELYRISSVGCSAFGKWTAIEDDCPIASILDANPAECDFIGFKRLAEESGETGPASVGPQGLVGVNEHNGTTAANIRYYQETHGNQSDSTVGIWVPDSNVTAECPADFIERNKPTSDRMMVGMRISKISTPPLVPNPEPMHIYGRHALVFDEELATTQVSVTMTIENDVDTGLRENRFDGLPTNYSLLPNGGGSCRFIDCASVHTGLGFSGSKVQAGTWVIEGVGVAVGPGDRVFGNDPCLTSDPAHCIAGLARRGSFTFDKVTITGGMYGFVCAESDCIGNRLTANLGNDLNAVDQNLKLARVALGVSAGKGVGIGWNVVTNEFLSNVPLDTTFCSVGDGSCVPAVVPGVDVITTSGVANLDIEYVNLHAQPEPFLPAGVGILCAQREGVCNVGSLDPAYPRGLISGFELAYVTSGPGNVDPGTGVPLRHDAEGAIAPSTANLLKTDIRDVEVGATIGTNIISTMNNVTISNTQFNAMVAGQDTANIATVLNSGCDSDDGVHCLNTAREYSSPNIGVGDEDYFAAIAGGISAPTYVSLINSGIGCTSCAVADNLLVIDPDYGLPSCTGPVTYGLAPVLPDALVDYEALTVTCVGTNSDLKVVGGPACFMKVGGLVIVTGADMMLYPNLVHGSYGYTECVASPGVVLYNRTSKNVVPDVSFAGSGFKKADGTFQTTGLIAGVKADPALQVLEARMESQIATKAAKPEDCQICVNKINWAKKGAMNAASNQCEQFVKFDNEAKDKRSACKAKCNALYSIAGYLADGQKQCLIDFCTAMNQQMAAGTRCVP